MKGREKKHQQITEYSKYTTYQNRWADNFRREYMQVIYLRENDFDLNIISTQKQHILWNKKQDYLNAPYH